MAEEGLLYGLAEGIVERLDAQAVKKWGLFRYVKDLENLKIIVSKIKDLLLHVHQPYQAPEIREWLQKIADAFYELDDLLDDFSTKVLPKENMAPDKMKKVRSFFSELNPLAFPCKTGLKIKAILKKLDALANARDFRIELLGDEIPVWNGRRENTESEHVGHVIGRERDAFEVLAHLMDSAVEDNVSVLSIVGLGGMGKTTLAQLVYNNEMIETYFQLKMWVCVSDDFDVKVIVRDILKSSLDIGDVEMSKLINLLRKHINGKKYLLVLDDVWNEDYEKWSRMKQLLMGGARGSKILVTTRSREVAVVMDSRFIHSLEGLNFDESWSLFNRMAFKVGDEALQNSEIVVAIGKEILKKCAGLPIAIRTIGRLMYLRNSEREWLSFKGNELSRIFENDDAIVTILKLSYDQLPPHLKHCFAYCSLFPKDYEINTSTLINLWIAQGLVKLSNQNDQCLEDAAQEYFMDLLSRQFLQVFEVDGQGNVTSCTMHDLVHDLAVHIAGPLFTRLERKVAVDASTRHVSAGYFVDLSSLLASVSKASRIRTILLFPSDGELPNKLNCDAIFSSFKMLRALQVGGIPLSLTSSSFRNLNILRFLDLSGMQFMKRLPDSITRLQNLQTLKLCNCSMLEELPRDIKRLVNLRHLDIHGCWKLTYMPRGLGQLTNLRSLSDFMVPSDSPNKHRGGLNELNGLNYLRGNLLMRNLGVGKDDAVDCKAANLKEKQNLYSLKLSWDDPFGLNYDVDDDIKLEGLEPHGNLRRLELRGYRGSSFPRWLLSLTNLVEFKLLSCTKLQCLPPLSQLPSLKCLSLEYLEDMEYISDSGDRNHESSSSSISVPVTFFPSLKELQLHYCPKLKDWWKTKHGLFLSFPFLSELSVSACTVLASMPMFPHLEEELVLSNASWKLMQQTLMENMGTPVCSTSTTIESSIFASSSFAPLSKLKRLRLHRIEDLQILPEEGLQNLTSLESLQIVHCHRLTSLSQGIKYLTGLQQLKINHCDNLDLGGNYEAGMGWQGLKSLLSLDFVGLPKLVSLPLGLQHVTTLDMFQISSCCMLIAIPDWICNWISLRQFEISNCPSLTSLPEGMHLLKSLKMLIIRKHCPILLPRCERETGEDWSKIAHIPLLRLDPPSMEEVKSVRKRFNAYHGYPSKVNTAVVRPKIQLGLLAYLLLFITLFNKKAKIE